jgi:F-type H+-transporting ATPase subunit delta
VAADLAGFSRALVDSPDLATVLESPEIETSRKKAVVASLAESMNPLVSRFLQMLVERGRIGEVAEIAAAFDARVAEAEGRIAVEAVTAVPLTDELRREIVSKVEADTGRKAALEERVDPELLGGLVLRVGGIAIDGSLRTRIEMLRRTLTEAPIEAPAAS